MGLKHLVITAGLSLGACAGTPQEVAPPTPETTHDMMQPRLTADQAIQFVADQQGALNEQLTGKRLTLGVALGWCTTWLFSTQRVAIYNPILSMVPVDNEKEIEFVHIPFAISPDQSLDSSHAVAVAGPHVVEGSYYDKAISPGTDLKWYANSLGTEDTQPPGPFGLILPKKVSVEQVRVHDRWLLQTSSGEPVAYAYLPNPDESDLSDAELCAVAEEAAITAVSAQNT